MSRAAAYFLPRFVCAGGRMSHWARRTSSSWYRPKTIRGCRPRRPRASWRRRSKGPRMSVHRNPVLWLAWGLPVVAVVASVITLFITIRHPDGQLPEQYHWEGFQLDRDFSRAARAAE